MPGPPSFATPLVKNDFQIPSRFGAILLGSCGVGGERDARVTEGLKPGEVAARLGLSVDLVRQHKSRALKRLKLAMLASSRTRPADR